MIQVLQNANSTFVKAYASYENYEVEHRAIADAIAKAKSDFTEKETHEYVCVGYIIDELKNIKVSNMLHCIKLVKLFDVATLSSFFGNFAKLFHTDTVRFFFHENKLFVCVYHLDYEYIAIIPRATRNNQIKQGFYFDITQPVNDMVFGVEKLPKE